MMQRGGEGWRLTEREIGGERGGGTEEQERGGWLRRQYGT